MRIRRTVLLVGVCGLALELFAWSQGRKAGLWEVTATMSWQQSPFPAGMGPMSQPRTTQVCVTQEQIDKFGTAPPQTHGDCQVNNVVKKATGMSAELVCTGQMSGKGDIQAWWNDDLHSSAKVHFLGAMQMGPSPKPIEWTVDSTSVYKGADCGSVKPIETQ
jgi:hypothetical protein